MTALAGLWHFQGRDTADGCRRMLKAQALYGQHSALRSDGPATIGRHLFRTLPEDVHDNGPVSGGEGRLLLAADVRIDNRAELASALGIAGPDLRVMSDARLLMRALEAWDEEAPARIAGDFAFALWDSGRQRLLLARDFMGQRPLHYHQGRDFFAFASMPKGLHALADVPYAVDEERLLESLAVLPEAGPATYFRGISRVEPGQIISVSASGISARKYWRPSLEPLQLGSAQDYDEALRAHMDAAVEARLRGAEGRVASQLSAGLDSSAVTATAARLLEPTGGKVVAYTAVPRLGYDSAAIRGAIADEGPLAAATAAMHEAIEHVLVRGSGRSPVGNLDRNFFLYDRPGGNLANFVWIDDINDAAKARGLRVLLTGAMGNFSFSYNGMELLPDLVARGRLFRLAGTAGALYRNGTRAGTIAAKALGPFLPGPVWQAIGRLRGHGGESSDHSALNLASAGRLEMDRRAAEQGIDPANRPRRDGVAARLLGLNRVDPGNFHKGVLGGWGIDTRDPTADRRLVEFCLRVPLGQYLRGGRQRALAKDALADRLPAVVLREPLKGYQAADWHEGLSVARAELADEVGRIARSPVAREVLDTARLSAWMEDWPDDAWDAPAVTRRYRIGLLAAASAGHFIRKVAGTN